MHLIQNAHSCTQCDSNSKADADSGSGGMSCLFYGTRYCQHHQGCKKAKKPEFIYMCQASGTVQLQMKPQRIVIMLAKGKRKQLHSSRLRRKGCRCTLRRQIGYADKHGSCQNNRYQKNSFSNLFPFCIHTSSLPFFLFSVTGGICTAMTLLLPFF